MFHLIFFPLLIGFQVEVKLDKHEIVVNSLYEQNKCLIQIFEPYFNHCLNLEDQELNKLSYASCQCFYQRYQREGFICDEDYQTCIAQLEDEKWQIFSLFKLHVIQKCQLLKNVASQQKTIQNLKQIEKSNQISESQIQQIYDSTENLHEFFQNQIEEHKRNQKRLLEVLEQINSNTVNEQELLKYLQLEVDQMLNRQDLFDIANFNDVDQVQVLIDKIINIIPIILDHNTIYYLMLFLFSIVLNIFLNIRNHQTIPLKLIPLGILLENLFVKIEDQIWFKIILTVVFILIAIQKQKKNQEFYHIMQETINRKFNKESVKARLIEKFASEIRRKTLNKQKLLE